MNKDLVGFAHKVLGFRMNVAKACKAKGIEKPSDEKIGEYLNLYGFNLKDFMDDYIEKEGIFRNPIDDFVKDIQALELDNPPSEEDIRKYAAEHGTDIAAFVKQHAIDSFKGISKKVLVKTLELEDADLVKLWNKFIEESALYGEDSYIYDLKDNQDNMFIEQNWPSRMKAELTRIKRNGILKNDEVRFIQWFAINDDDTIYVKKDIAAIIIAYWGEIFERIITYPEIYNGELLNHYFTNIVWDVVKEKVNFEE